MLHEAQYKAGACSCAYVIRIISSKGKEMWTMETEIWLENKVLQVGWEHYVLCRSHVDIKLVVEERSINISEC